MIDISVLIAIISITVLFIFNLLHYRNLIKQMENNFYSDFTKRYQQIALHFPVNIFDDDFNFDTLDKEKKDETLRYLRIYFDLCYDQWFLNEQGKIDDTVWKDWEKGICYYLTRKSFIEAWNILCKKYGFYIKFKEYVDKKIKEKDID